MSAKPRGWNQRPFYWREGSLQLSRMDPALTQSGLPEPSIVVRVYDRIPEAAEPRRKVVHDLDIDGIPCRVTVQVLTPKT